VSDKTEKTISKLRPPKPRSHPRMVLPQHQFGFFCPASLHEQSKSRDSYRRRSRTALPFESVHLHVGQAARSWDDALPSDLRQECIRIEGNTRATGFQQSDDLLIETATMPGGLAFELAIEGLGDVLYCDRGHRPAAANGSKLEPDYGPAASLSTGRRVRP